MARSRSRLVLRHVAREILDFLRTGDAQPVAEIAKGTGYTPRSVYRSIEVLAGRGLVVRHYDTRPSRHQVTPEGISALREREHLI